MTAKFRSPLAKGFAGFLQFKRERGYRYVRAEFMLRSLDRFVCSMMTRGRAWRLEQAVLAWLGRGSDRKAVTVGAELTVVREFWRYLHRQDPKKFGREPQWPVLPSQTHFLPHVLSRMDIRLLLRGTERLERPRFRRVLYRTLLFVLYCTGLRFGEALRLRIRDVDLRRRTFFVAEFKGRSRWVPFHPSLAVELARYLKARRHFIGRAAEPDDRLFVGSNRSNLPVRTAWGTLSKLFRASGLKPSQGRVGPRPYDIRHTFAVHRLTRWYRQGIDLHTRLPWLSAYLGHVNILGTETYLNATPELLAFASERFRRRYAGRRRR